MTGPGAGEDGWRQTLAVDILAGVVGAEAALAALERSAAASVVFIGSTASMEFFNGPRPYGCGSQKLDLRAVQGVPRLQSHSRMAHTALDISPRSRHNKSVES
jgi:NADP-dependent 3-hydroxy acid dehydrogenase YdfG